MLLTNQVQECTISIKDAQFPVPFLPALEFNPPVHGTWNIVHIGMNVPQAHQIYVCAINCMRGVVLTAAEMNCQDRFSCVILEEKDIVNGTVEEVTIEGVTDVLNRMEALPPVVLLFTVCTYHFIGCSLKRIYGTLQERFPMVAFAPCFMDPIMQKKGLTPDQKLRRSMGELLEGRECQKGVALLGCDFPLDETSDLKRILKKEEIPVKEIHDCDTFQEYREMGNRELFVCTYPAGEVGIRAASRRLDRAFFYLPSCFGYEEIYSEWKKLGGMIGNEKGQDVLPWMEQERMREEALCEQALENAKEVIRDTTITIDGAAHPRPLGMARLLLEHGFCVKKVYLDAISKEEEGDYLWLQEHAPDLQLSAIIQPEGRVRKRGGDEKILAIGQKAAWYSDTGYFVNIVQGKGLWGYDGIRKLAYLMIEAFETEKDTRDIVPRKGLGCESCI